MEGSGEFRDPFDEAENPAVRKILNMLLLIMVKNELDEISIRSIGGEMKLLADIDELVPPPAELLLGLVTRVKCMAKLNSAIDEVEQTGRFELDLERAGILRCRVSTIPSPEGEGVLIVREG